MSMTRRGFLKGLAGGLAGIVAAKQAPAVVTAESMMKMGRIGGLIKPEAELAKPDELLVADEAGAFKPKSEVGWVNDGLVLRSKKNGIEIDLQEHDMLGALGWLYSEPVETDAAMYMAARRMADER